MYVRVHVRGSNVIPLWGATAKKRGRRESDHRPKTAAPTGLESRRLRRNGDFDPKCDDRRKRESSDSTAVRIEIAPLYAELRAELQAYSTGRNSMTLRNGHSHCPQRLKSTNVRFDFLPVLAV